jgi:hypothetical protein
MLSRGTAGRLSQTMSAVCMERASVLTYIRSMASSLSCMHAIVHATGADRWADMQRTGRGRMQERANPSHRWPLWLLTMACVARACVMPFSVSTERSVEPCTREAAFHVLWPCLMITTRVSVAMGGNGRGGASFRSCRASYSSVPVQVQRRSMAAAGPLAAGGCALSLLEEAVRSTRPEEEASSTGGRGGGCLLSCMQRMEPAEHAGIWGPLIRATRHDVDMHSALCWTRIGAGRCKQARQASTA